MPSRNQEPENIYKKEPNSDELAKLMYLNGKRFGEMLRQFLTRRQSSERDLILADFKNKLKEEESELMGLIPGFKEDVALLRESIQRQPDKDTIAAICCLSERLLAHKGRIAELEPDRIKRRESEIRQRDEKSLRAPDQTPRLPHFDEIGRIQRWGSATIHEIKNAFAITRKFVEGIFKKYKPRRLERGSGTKATRFEIKHSLFKLLIEESYRRLECWTPKVREDYEIRTDLMNRLRFVLINQKDFEQLVEDIDVGSPRKHAGGRPRKSHKE